MTKNILNIVLYQAVWAVAVVGAAHGRPWIGPIAAAIVLVQHVARASHRFAEGRLVICSALIGFGCDTLLALSGLFEFESHTPTGWPCPLWMGAIWLGFATTLNGGLAWLKGRLPAGAAFGLFGGPLAYWAATSIGAIRLGSRPFTAYAAVALEYAVLVPLMLKLASLCVSRRGTCAIPLAKKRAA